MAAKIETPQGWRAVAISNIKQTRLAYSKEVWADIRPLAFGK